MKRFEAPSKKLIDGVRTKPLKVVPDERGRLMELLRADDDDFGQAGTLYRKVLSATDKDHLVANVCGHMRSVTNRVVLERALGLWHNIDPELGDRISAGLGLTPASAAR